MHDISVSKTISSLIEFFNQYDVQCITKRYICMNKGEKCRWIIWNTVSDKFIKESEFMKLNNKEIFNKLL